MPDLERWLTEIEGRHNKAQPTSAAYCAQCGQNWPCDTITLARVVRAQAKTVEFYAGYRASQSQQRIAAIISGEEASGE